MASRKEVLKLPTTSYIILGLLTFEEMSGYDLKLLADRSVKYFYWSPTKSQIYSELRRLESHGLVTMREVIQERRPDKRIYTITQPDERPCNNGWHRQKLNRHVQESVATQTLFWVDGLHTEPHLSA
jgi:DNA-binding PadR family transcriptional regulator